MPPKCHYQIISIKFILDCHIFPRKWACLLKIQTFQRPDPNSVCLKFTVYGQIDHMLYKWLDWSIALFTSDLMPSAFIFFFFFFFFCESWEGEKTTPDYKAITSQLDHLMVPSPIKERTLMFDFNFFKIVGSIMRFRSGAIYFHMGRWAQRSKFQLAWEKSSWISCKISLEWTTDEGERERARAQKVAA